MKKIFSFLSAILFAGALMATEVSVTIHASSGDYYAKANGWENGTQYSQVILDDNITANLVGTGNNGKYYSDWRFYTNGSDEVRLVLTLQKATNCNRLPSSSRFPTAVHCTWVKPS